MAFDVEAALVGMRNLMLTIPDLQVVGIGAPEHLSAQVVGWVTVADLDEEVAQFSAGGPYDIRISLIQWFGYSLGGDEDTGERKLSQYLAQLTRRLIQNRMRTVDGVAVLLNGSVSRMGLPRPAASPADYATYAGAEARTYPIAVTVTLSETVS